MGVWSWQSAFMHVSNFLKNCGTLFFTYRFDGLIKYSFTYFTVISYYNCKIHTRLNRFRNNIHQYSFHHNPFRPQAVTWGKRKRIKIQQMELFVLLFTLVSQDQNLWANYFFRDIYSFTRKKILALFFEMLFFVLSIWYKF